MTPSKPLTGLIIGRYQPPHLTHLEVFKFAKRQGIEKLLIVKGSADKYRIPRHPFTPDECIDMVEMYLKRAGLNYEIFPLEDVSQNIKQDDEELSEKDIEAYTCYAKKLVAMLPPFDVAIVGNPTIGTPLERLGYRIIKPQGSLNCSATYIRKQYVLHGDRCEDLLLPEQVKYMDAHGLYDVIKSIGQEEFKEALVRR